MALVFFGFLPATLLLLWLAVTSAQLLVPSLPLTAITSSFVVPRLEKLLHILAVLALNIFA